MRAFVLQAYGSADNLQLVELDRPRPGPGEVLVRVRATSINPYDWHCMRGEPVLARFMGVLGLRRPRITVLGCDVAGEVVEVGPGVTRFAPDDAVYALLPGGGFGEYVVVKESELAAKPAGLSFEQAAAMPMAGVTALHALRDVGRVQPGQRVLVNGASGGVGTFAVQLAKALGAEVTGVCSTRNTGLVTELGADRVIDYTRQDFTADPGGYHLMIDIAGSRSPRVARRVLTRDGCCVVVGGRGGRWVQPVGHTFGALALGLFVSQRMALADAVPDRRKAADLSTLGGLVEAGELTPAVDRAFAFEEIPDAVRYQEQGHAPAKVVVTHGGGDAPR